MPIQAHEAGARAATTVFHPHLQRPPPSTPPRPPHPPARLRAHAPRGPSAGRATLSERAPPAGLRLVPPAVEHVSASVRHAARRQRLLQLHRPGLISQADHDQQPDRGLHARPRPSRPVGRHPRPASDNTTASIDPPTASRALAPPPPTSRAPRHLRPPHSASEPPRGLTKTRPKSGLRHPDFCVFSGPHFPSTT